MKYITGSSGWGAGLAAIPVIMAAFHFIACTKPPETNANVTNTHVSRDSNVAAPVTAPSPSPQSLNILFIVDSSGSMKAKAGTKTKMEVAKQVVTDLIKQIPATTNTGLMVYGHRRKKDCTDVELVIPVGPTQPGPFSEKINALEPLGETPISNSIRQAADVLKPLKGKKTVILISDGEETCNEDPCALAAELKKADVELKIHVVGFGIDKEASKKQLYCIAESTGGVYKDAKDAAQLEETLEGLAKAEEAPPTGDKGRLVINQLDSQGKRIFWCVEVYPEGRSDIPSRVVETCGDPKATENAYEIVPGRYDIWVYGANVRSKPAVRTVEIFAGRDTPMPIEQTGRIFLNIVDQNGAAVQYVAQVKNASDNIRAGATFYSGEWHELVSGTYEISVWGGPIGVDNPKGVVIRPGQ